MRQFCKHRIKAFNHYSNRILLSTLINTLTRFEYKSEIHKAKTIYLYMPSIRFLVVHNILDTCCELSDTYKH